MCLCQYLDRLPYMLHLFRDEYGDICKWSSAPWFTCPRIALEVRRRCGIRLGEEQASFWRTSLLLALTAISFRFVFFIVNCPRALQIVLCSRNRIVSSADRDPRHRQEQAGFRVVGKAASVGMPPQRGPLQGAQVRLGSAQ